MQADVKTLSVRLGPKRVFWACIVLLQIAYAGAIGLGALSQVTFIQIPIALHCMLYCVCQMLNEVITCICLKTMAACYQDMTAQLNLSAYSAQSQ